ncbi:DUF3419 family protein [Deinococcus maricopensis]|uniref:S-adenosylmethionine:diacylglycerol 3-amino-3-carboxypropyl transferase-like protein n=1 Tax=Deinococcus maricopensis (strain DSM 21211 / LMG 22137 / NRRL B-23946 / LB-34) TaxID=709986 RepID=E8U6X8_DEIML|nr:BtaA family protein [Deinococcus maricopensis]ADV66817.1 S-adenosylmethionine:diacylglycerol 3-amino-3-carboxypropyl transferase-like protein [Deinococcus maricopensis DSM 21211]
MSEILTRAKFDQVRYAQVWEDADTLLAALDVQPGDTVLSIASAGDNALALLTRDPAWVVAVDLSAAQLHCLALRVAAFRALEHAELLELVGSVPSDRRAALYARCRPHLDDAARAFWDARPDGVAAGIGTGQVGKFERYFDLFRRRVLPLLLSRADIRDLLTPHNEAERHAFYARRVDTWRWRLLFRLFFSRAVMGRLGRDPAFFRYVQGSVAGRIQARAQHAMTALDPSANPYLQWIVTGTHARALPLWLRAEHFGTIRDRVDRLTWRQASVEAYLSEAGPRSIDRFNLSDIFEYMSEDATGALLARLADAGRPGGRLAYWNLLAPRSRPEALAGRLGPLTDLAATLHAGDKAFFYDRLVIEAVR